MSLTGTRAKPLKRYEVVITRKVTMIHTRDGHSVQDVKRILTEGGLLRVNDKLEIKEIK